MGFGRHSWVAAALLNDGISDPTAGLNANTAAISQSDGVSPNMDGYSIARHSFFADAMTDQAAVPEWFRRGHR